MLMLVGRVIGVSHTGLKEVKYSQLTWGSCQHCSFRTPSTITEFSVLSAKIPSRAIAGISSSMAVLFPQSSFCQANICPGIYRVPMEE